LSSSYYSLVLPDALSIFVKQRLTHELPVML
jgi:hypothetical protein